MSIPQHLQYRFKSDKPLGTIRYVGPVVDRLVDELLPDGARIIDIGCGNGGSTGRLLDRGYRITGVDPSEQGIGMARENYPLGDWRQTLAHPGLLGDLDEPAFDAGISIEVVEHVYAPRDWARCCFECIRPGGFLICSTPYHGYIKNVALSVANKWDSLMDPLWDGGHIKLWSRKTLSRLLAEAGFVDLQFHGAGRLPALWMSMIMVARRPG